MARTNHFEDREDDTVETETEGEQGGDTQTKTLGASWGAWKNSKNRSSFTDDFRPTEDRQIIKFLDDNPFAVVDRHWIDRRPYFCPASKGEPCPLCRTLGDRPTTTAFLTVAVMGSGVTVARWATTGRVARQLMDYGNDDVIKRIDRDNLYFSVVRSSSGKKNQQVVTILPVKERDLSEDFGIEPLSDKELAQLRTKRLTVDSITFPDPDTLSEVVRKKMSGDSDF